MDKQAVLHQLCSILICSFCSVHYSLGRRRRCEGQSWCRWAVQRRLLDRLTPSGSTHPQNQSGWQGDTPVSCCSTAGTSLRNTASFRAYADSTTISSSLQIDCTCTWALGIPYIGLEKCFSRHAQRGINMNPSQSWRSPALPPLHIYYILNYCIYIRFAYSPE